MKPLIFTKKPYLHPCCYMYYRHMARTSRRRISRKNKCWFTAPSQSWQLYLIIEENNSHGLGLFQFINILKYLIHRRILDLSLYQSAIWTTVVIFRSWFPFFQSDKKKKGFFFPVIYTTFYTNVHLSRTLLGQKRSKELFLVIQIHIY